MRQILLSFILLATQIFSPAYGVERILKADIIEGQDTVKNLLGSKGHFEKNALGVTGFKDAAATTPVDLYEASPSNTVVTCARTTSAPLSGVGSLLLTHTNADGQGEGCALAFTIDTKMKYQVLQVQFDYAIPSGDYTDDYLDVWIYDVTNGALIQPAPYHIKDHGLASGQPMALEFQATSGTSYRIGFYSSSSNTTAYTMSIDDIKISKSAKLYGSPVTDWVSYTPTITGSTTNPTKGTTVTDRGMWRRVGDSMELTYQYKQTVAGSAGSGAYYVSLPSGYTIDINKLAYAASLNGSATGNCGTFQATGGGADPLLLGTVQASTSTTLGFYYGTDAVATTYFGSASSGNFADTNLEWSFRCSVPITGWSSSLILSSDAATNVVAAYSTAVVPTGTISGTNAAVFGTVTKDSHGAYNTSTGKYRIPVSGWYRATFSTEISHASIAVGNTVGAYIYLDGVYKGGNAVVAQSTAALTHFPSGTQVVYATAGQDLWFVGASNGTTPVYGGGLTLSTFQIERISGPASIAASETVRFYTYTGSPTGTLNTSYNKVTYLTSGTYVDSHGAFSSGRFTAPVSGTYEFKASYALTHTTAAGYEEIGIAKNGDTSNPFITSYYYLSGSGDSMTFPLNGEIKLLAGDYIEVVSKTSLTTPAFTSSASRNYFMVTRVGNY